jgi:septal ring-binding cell division protein DamX
LGLGLKVNDAGVHLSAEIAELIRGRISEESFLLIAQNIDQGPDNFIDVLLSLRAEAVSVEERLRQVWLIDTSSETSLEINEQEWYIQRLLPLDEEGAYQYLKDRFTAAGCVEGFPVNTKDVTRLNEIAKGIPQELNHVARDYLISSTFQTTEKSRSFPITHIAAGAVALTLVVIAILYQANESYSPNSVTPAASEPNASSSMSAVEQKLADAIAQVEARQTPTTPEPKDTVMPQDVALNPKPDVKPPAQVLPTKPAVSVPQETVTAPEPVQQPSVPAKSESLMATAKGNEYTLQLIGVRDRSKLEPLLKKFNDDAPVEVVKTTYKDAAGYVLIYGHFPNKQAAQQGAGDLPKGLGVSEPWSRTFESIRSTQ